MAHRRAESGVGGGQQPLQRLLGAGRLLAQDRVELQGIGIHGGQEISTGRLLTVPSGPLAISATRASAASSRFSQWARSSAPRA